MPRVECAEHGVSQVATPWAEPGSRITALLKAVVIDWLKEASLAAVAWRLGLTRRRASRGDEVDGVMARAVEVVAMDMWAPYMDAAAKWLPKARVCFDRFHVVRHLCDAVNTVRRQEHRRLRAEGDGMLTGTKYLWVESPASMRPERRNQ